ncbi:MAG: hypothetical protein KDC46_16480, partial [Thermoleophilia bacterium]|nr:hypothetical protein [Thermoleophilia bacterium]
AYFTASVSSPDLTALSDTQAASATFVARLAPGADTRGGERISLRPDLDEVHLFDPASMLTLLAPADEREVRARQVGAAVELAGGTASHPGSVVASPSPAHVLQATAHAPAQQQQPVIHLYQTIVGHDGAPLAGPVGTLGEQDPTRIASVFDQPVAAPVALEPLMPAADGSVATTASAHPRPTFASQVGAGSTLDPALTTAPGITMPAPGASPATMQGDDDRAHAPTPTPTSDDQVAPTGDAANAPARAPRGFAPRTIGPVEPTVVASAPDARPAETARLTETDLDAAIDAIDAVGAAPAASVEPAPAADDARQGHHSPLARLRPHGDAESLGSSFRDALERIRSKHPVLTGETRSHPSVLPPPMLLGSPQLDLNGLPTDAMTSDAIRHEPDAQAPHLNDRADDSTET